MASERTSWIESFYQWRLRNFSNRTFLVLASVAVGLVVGLVAVALKASVHEIHLLVRDGEEFQARSLLLFATPFIGIFLTALFVQKVLKGNLGKGVAGILYDIARRNSNISRDKTWTHVVTSAITVGMGGSAGLEGPIVVTGAAIGSNMSRAGKLQVKERTILLACGAAAGIGAVFNSPVAGVLFAIEILLTEFSATFFIPLLISAATGAVISKALYPHQFFFLISEDWKIQAIPFYVLLGLFSGLLAVYFLRMTYFTEKLFTRLRSPWVKALIGGTVLGLLIFFFPPLYGEGYITIDSLLGKAYHHLLDLSLFGQFRDSGLFIVLFAAGVILLKVVATTITLEAGGNGGIFAPSLFLGAMSGFVFAHTLNLLGLTELNEVNFIVAGMAGAIAGVLHAPLTAIFLIAEVTGGYILFVPLMTVSAFSFFTSRYFEPHSIYTKRLAKRGITPGDRDQNILIKLKIKNLVETNFTPVSPSLTLGEFVQLISASKRNIFPVTDKNGKLAGVVLMDNIRDVMFRQELYEQTNVRDLMTPAPAVVRIDDNVYDVAEMFDKLNVWNLPVVDENETYLGFVSKSALLSKYREMLIKHSEPVG